MPSKLKLSVFIFIALFLFQAGSFGAFKKMPGDDWGKALNEMNIKPDTALLDKLVKSGDTIEKVQSQTKGNLRVDNWISIFKKLGIEPKPDMQAEEWTVLFDKIGLEYKKGPVISQTERAQQPATPYTPPLAQAPSQPQSTPQAQIDNTQPVTTLPVPVKQVPVRTDKQVRVNLDLRDSDIYSALKLLSQRAGLSIVAASNVKGSVSIYLQDIDALDALKIILEMNNLAYVRDGNVFKVMTDQDYEKVYGKRFYDITTAEIIRMANTKPSNIEKVVMPLKSKVGQIISDPGTNSFIIIDTPENIDLLKKFILKLDVKMETKVYALNYAKTKDIVDKVKNAASPGTGTVQSDDRTNQIIVTDYPDKISDITNLVASLDKRNHEVLIEAKIMQILLNDNFQMGVNWDSVFTKVNGSNISGEVTANLSASNPGASAIRLNVGTLASNNFTALYDILQTVGKTNMVSAPKIATLEGQEAKMLVGTKEAYVTTTVSTPGTGASTTAENVTFIDVGVKLFVTPDVGDDGFITMKIRPEVSSVDRSLTTAQGNSIPIVRTSESETTVMVKDGVTIVIGGLMEERKEKTVSGIPLLCRIPVLGSLFGRTSYITSKTELAILLTPHVITGEAGVTPEEKEKYKLKNK